MNIRPAHKKNLIFIGDIHGCVEELLALMKETGCQFDAPASYEHSAIKDLTITYPEDTQYVFLGDICDRGPYTPSCYEIVMHAVHSGNGFMVIGNHDWKLYRYLIGNDVQISDGLQESITQIFSLNDHERFIQRLTKFLELRETYILFDEDKICASHAGLGEGYHGQSRAETLNMATYGPYDRIRGERINPADTHTGYRILVHGHTPIDKPSFENNVIDVDTGCVFGNTLSCLIYPSMEFKSVPAIEDYFEKWSKKK